MKDIFRTVFCLSLFVIDLSNSQKVFFSSENVDIENNTISIRDVGDATTIRNGFSTESPDIVIPVDDCGSEYGRVTKLHLTPPCESNGDGKTCVLQRGQRYVLNATFVPKIRAEELILHIHRVDPNFGFGTQLHPPKSACGRFGLECPAEADVPVDAVFGGTYPIGLLPIKVTARIFLTGEDEKMVFACKQLPLDFQ